MWRNLNETDNRTLVELTNRLLAVNFIVRDKERELYYKTRQFEKELRAFFSMIGWELIVDERHECIFLSSGHSQHRKNLRKDESVWFLILSLLYREKRRELTISTFPTVTIFEIRQKYETFRLPWVGRTRLEQLVRICAKYHLIDVVDGGDYRDESRFQLYHTWQYVIAEEDLAVLGERIIKYTDGEGDFDEMAEESQVD